MIKTLKLSKIYEDKRIWAVAYDTGLNSIELLDKIFTSKAKAVAYAKRKKPKEYLGGQLRIIGLSTVVLDQHVG
jgi:hypothetical protein